MSFNPIVDGKPVTALMNSNWELALRGIGQNAIQQLQDRDVTFSADGGMFAEAYTDSNGRKNSVVGPTRNSIGEITEGTTSAFDTDKYVASSTNFSNEASGDTTHDPNSATNPENVFDENTATFATWSTASDYTYRIGKTFAAKTISSVYLKATAQNAGGSSNPYVALEKYDGATWTTVFSDNSSPSDQTYDGTYYLNEEVQGLRVVVSSGGTGTVGTKTGLVYELSYGQQTGDIIVVHTIPSGTFADDISTAFMTFKAAENGWESGADVQFKLTNATEDTGYLSANEVVSFTALTAEPDECIVKLIPKTTSPTAGYPSINGVFLTAGRPS